MNNADTLEDIVKFVKARAFELDPKALKKCVELRVHEEVRVVSCESAEQQEVYKSAFSGSRKRVY